MKLRFDQTSFDELIDNIAKNKKRAILWTVRF